MITTLNQNLMSGFPAKRRLVAEYEVTGSAVTTITFNGLDLVGHGGVWEIEIGWVCNTDLSCYAALYANGDTTGGNYGGRRINCYGSTVATMAFGGGTVCWGQTVGTVTLANITMSLINNHVVANSIAGEKSATEATLHYYYKTTTDTNITRLDFMPNVSSAIGIGSKISIYRKQ